MPKIAMYWNRTKLKVVQAFGFAILPLSWGLLFFAASLTPSLIPRGWIVQGVLAGTVMAIGYMLGRIAIALWWAMELPSPEGTAKRVINILVLGPSVAVLIWALSNFANWQDSVRAHVGLIPESRLQLLALIPLAIVTFLILFFLGFLVQRLFIKIRGWLYRLMPPRTANVLGFILLVIVTFVGTRDWVVPALIERLDATYEVAQKLFLKAPPIPVDDRLPGSANSFIDWGAMGQPGRNFVLEGPGAEAISEFSGRPAKNPIRVYVGRAQDKDAEKRAELALEELKRLRAFDRKILVVASPTGTGWLDPAGHDPVEYIHNGDIATVAVQYSYLQSPFALIFETNSGLDQVMAVMRAIYGYWTTLPPDRRPELYLHGISLGAWSSMHGFDIFQMVDDPINGALWVGPPFPSELWNRATARRNQDSSFVMPRVGDGRLFRFMNQYSGPGKPGDRWGKMHIVYLQYASDAIVFFDPYSIWSKPEWMQEPSAPDVSPELIFMPVVTQLQLALDMALSKAVPDGYGHNYLAAHYIDAWLAVTEPEGWNGNLKTRLKERCDIKWGIGCKNTTEDGE